MLGEHSAEVIKIEPLNTNPTRMLPLNKDDRSAFYVQYNCATLKCINLNLVMCSISRFGQDSSLASLPGYDYIGQPYTGILDMNGEPDTALNMLQDARIPSLPILNVFEVMEHPHTQARNRVRTVVDPVWGPLKTLHSPLRFSALSDIPEQTTGFLGEHNPEILSEVLGYSAENIATLKAGGLFNSNRFEATSLFQSKRGRPK